ncbi:MAG: GAF domain-containing sensor histidine kinase [Caldilineales bacterium]
MQHTLHQYNVQIETAAEVARATVSTLELDVLLNTAVDLICRRYGLDYVGIYLVNLAGDCAILRAFAGLDVDRLNPNATQLRLSGNSTVSRCIATVNNLVESRTIGSSEDDDSSWVQGTESELALPLVSGDRVLGALTVQSAELGAFSSLNIAGFQIVTDQLANAIQNANLYADARRRADELAAAYEQLKELELLKDQFMQNISHELRTPLTMIRGYAELMASNQLGTLDADQLDAVNVILRYSNALTVLVDDIMAIMDVGTSKTTRQPVLLAELLHTSLLDFQVLAGSAGVHLVFDIDEDEPRPVIYANPDHLRRIVENLIGNAVKFTPAGGHVQVQLEERDNVAVVQVSDTGIGIPRDMLPHVFDRFFQVDGSRRRRYGGAGLGLALVKELAESYGGTVTADSPGIDRGSTFVVALPTMAQ